MSSSLFCHKLPVVARYHNVLMCVIKTPALEFLLPKHLLLVHLYICSNATATFLYIFSVSACEIELQNMIVILYSADAYICVLFV